MSGNFNLVRPGQTYQSIRQFESGEPLVLGDPYDTGAELFQDPYTGAVRRRAMTPQAMPPRAPVPQRAPAGPPQRIAGLGPASTVQVTSTGESRNGLSLMTANTAGNNTANIFATQLTAQHPFLCVAYRVRWGWTNDPAAVNDSRVYLVSAQTPTISGLAKKDGQIILWPGKEEVVVLARPEQILQSTTLGPGSWTLQGGTAPMSFIVMVDYWTQLDLIVNAGVKY